VKELGANLVKVMYEIEIEAEAMHLPHEIEVDISVLKGIDQSIAAKDIALPAGVTLVTKPEEVVALIAEHKEEEEVPVEGPDMEAIGISEERGKKEEEGGETAPAEKGE
jgi:large subunit ribosomal protein L25